MDDSLFLKSKPEEDFLDSDEFTRIYVELQELQEQYELTPSVATMEQIQTYQQIVDDYIHKNNLSEEKILTIIEYATL